MVGGATPSTWNFGPTGPRWNEIADFEPIFARSASAITPSEKSSINTNRKSTTRFPMSLEWLLYVATKPPRGGAQKRKTAVFRVKSDFAWRKSATKFLCVKTVSNKVVWYSLAYLFVQKWLVGEVPFKWKLWQILTTLLQIVDFQYVIFPRSASFVTPAKKFD